MLPITIHTIIEQGLLRLIIGGSYNLFCNISEKFQYCNIEKVKFVKINILWCSVGRRHEF